MRTNYELEKLIKRVNIVGFIKTQKLKWLGHIMRANKRIVKSITNWKPLGKKAKQKSRNRWMGYLLEDRKIIKKMTNWMKNTRKSGINLWRRLK